MRSNVLIEQLEVRRLLSGDGLQLPVVSFQVAEQQLLEAGRTVASATADLNGDGILDVIIASRESHEISFHLGAADGRYHPHGSAPIRTEATDLALADLDQDGHLDLLVATGSRSIVFRNLGTSEQWNGFDAPSSFSNRATSVQLADLNGDEIPDLVGGTEQAVEVRFGQGDGTFEDRIVYLPATGRQLVAIADVDQDDDLDVIAAAASTTQFVVILLNQGDGILETGTSWKLKTPANTVWSSDISGDGMPDVIVGSNQQEGHNVWVFRGSGNGAFLSEADNYETTGAPLAFAVADINRDRIDDLMVAHDGTFHHPIAGNGPGGISVLQGTESGNLGEAIRVVTKQVPDIQAANDGTIFGVNTWNSTLVQLRPTAHEPVQAVFNYAPRSSTNFTQTAYGDFNGDGRLDAVIADSFLSGGLLHTYLGQPDGSFAHAFESQLEFTLERIFPVRADDNARDDLLLVGRNDRSQPFVYTWLSTSEGRFQEVYAARQGATSLAVADLNEDGIDDYVAFDRAGTVSRAQVYLAVGDGSFERFGQPLRLEALWDFRLVDVNGDQHTDLLGRSGLGLEVATGDGNGSFAAATLTKIDNGAYGLGDIDGDGDLDAVVANYDGSRSTLRVGLASETGSFAFGEEVRIDEVTHSVYVTQFAASSPEILVGIDEGLLVLGREDGKLVARRRSQLGFPPSRFLSTGMDGDSQTRVVTSLGGLFINSSPSTSLGFLEVDAEGRVSGPATMTSASVIDGNLVAADDLNGDGAQDFLVTHRWGFATWLTSVSSTTIPGDYDKDGNLDADDIDLLRDAMKLAKPGPADLTTFDLTGDQAIDALDLEFWLGELAGTVRGDVNLDGHVAFDDFLVIAENFGQPMSLWSEGDLDGDGAIGFADFLKVSILFGFGGPPSRGR